MLGICYNPLNLIENRFKKCNISPMRGQVISIEINAAVSGGKSKK
jgi:hypothetical protein